MLNYPHQKCLKKIIRNSEGEKGLTLFEFGGHRGGEHFGIFLGKEG